MAGSMSTEFAYRLLDKADCLLLKILIRGARTGTRRLPHRHTNGARTQCQDQVGVGRLLGSGQPEEPRFPREQTLDRFAETTCHQRHLSELTTQDLGITAKDLKAILANCRPG